MSQAMAADVPCLQSFKQRNEIGRNRLIVSSGNEDGGGQTDQQPCTRTDSALSSLKP